MNNSAELEVRLVGPSNEHERDARPLPVIRAYPLKDVGKPHCFGFDDYDDEYKKQAQQEFKAFYSTAGTTGYQKAGHFWRQAERYENSLDRKNIMTLSRNHTIKIGAMDLDATFMREASWLMEAGNHVLDPGILVFGSAALDDLKLETLKQLNTNPQLAATTIRMMIVLDHGQKRMRAHEESAVRVRKRPPWMVPAAIVEQLSLYEVLLWVESRQLPFRFQRVRRMLHVLDTQHDYRGRACVMDLAGDPMVCACWIRYVKRPQMGSPLLALFSLCRDCR